MTLCYNNRPPILSLIPVIYNSLGQNKSKELELWPNNEYEIRPYRKRGGGAGCATLWIRHCMTCTSFDKLLLLLIACVMPCCGLRYEQRSVFDWNLWTGKRKRREQSRRLLRAVSFVEWSWKRRAADMWMRLNCLKHSDVRRHVFYRFAIMSTFFLSGSFNFDYALPQCVIHLLTVDV